MITDEQMHNIILVHVARTWERIRLEQPFKEMPQDNIESASVAIPEIAYEIYKDDVIQKLINYKKNDWDWEVMTKGETHFSDLYIEGRAEKIIYNEYIHADVMLRRALDLRAKNNVLIAEFMGVKSYEASGYTNFVYSEDNHRTEVDLSYHDSWDWLMPVAEKCLTTDEPTDGHHYFINDALLTCNIDVVYDRVVEFIKDINKRLTDET